MRRVLPVKNLPAALAGKRLVQISDLHAGPIVDQTFLKGALAAIEQLRPDWIVLTGDFMTCDGAEQIGRAIEAVRALPEAPMGVAAVLGNHDYGQWWQRPDVADQITADLRRLDIQVLRNEVVDFSGLQILGVDDFFTPNFDPQRALDQLEPHRAAVALCHNPDGVDDPAWNDYQGWILAGHTHGGQCKPPFLDPPLIPVRNRRYTSGEFALSGGRRLYINRGVGYLRRVRFNCRPEVTLFRLERDQTEA